VRALAFGLLVFAGISSNVDPARSLVWGVLGVQPALAAPQEAHRPPVEVTVNARKYAFSPARIEVNQDDIVKITLKAEDIPHSFTVDKYRIAKRAAPGQPVTFEFRADQAGSFPFYCNLTSDERCKEMRGELVVNAKK
jgi:heme/copper-type cytochrome/quinol oxidase subunit 2